MVVEKLYKFHNFITKEECDYFISQIPLQESYDVDSWDHRIFPISENDWQTKHLSHIITRVQAFLKEKINVSVDLLRCQLQIWPIGSESNLHVHYNPITPNDNFGDWNCSLYLNDDFEGGEFIMEDGPSFKPEPGLLTFYNGVKDYHGLNRVESGNHRFTVLFWWDNTNFDDVINN